MPLLSCLAYISTLKKEEYVSPKLRWTSIGPNSVKTQKMTNAVNASSPKKMILAQSSIYTYIKPSVCFHLLVSCNKFAGIPMEEPLECYITRCLQRKHAKQITRENNMRVQFTMARRLHRELEIIQTVFGHMAWYRRYVQTRQISKDMENFIFAEATKINHIQGLRTRCSDKRTHLLSRIN